MRVALFWGPMTKTLISGGTVVTAVDSYVADVAIVDGKIAAIFGPHAAPAGPWETTIDARGKYVIPGGIDAHTHLDMPFGGTTSSDDFETGTRAAAYVEEGAEARPVDCLRIVDRLHLRRLLHADSYPGP